MATNREKANVKILAHTLRHKVPGKTVLNQKLSTSMERR